MYVCMYYVLCMYVFIYTQGMYICMCIYLLIVHNRVIRPCHPSHSMPFALIHPRGELAFIFPRRDVCIYVCMYVCVYGHHI